MKRIKGGYSLNQIVKELNLAKSTIYYHYRKFHGKRRKEIDFVSCLSMNEGELLGIVVGDGCLLNYKKEGKYQIYVYFGKANMDYVSYVKNRFEKFLNREIKIYSANKDTVRINIISKKVYAYFKTFLEFKQETKHSTVMVNGLKKLPRDFKIGFLRGLIDTDGCISREKNGRLKVQFFTTSEKLNKQVIQLIRGFGFNCGSYSVPSHLKKGLRGEYYMAKEYYSVYLLKKDVIPFINLIKPYKAKKYGLVD